MGNTGENPELSCNRMGRRFIARLSQRNEFIEELSRSAMLFRNYHIMMVFKDLRGMGRIE